ncbi:hypothetical protein ACPOL_6894 (plasmid) [Acidisarcina polymorpha]|uniref:Uncharacterized protein n=1 Tax=Acidisarcina polymorpha TaxID=2211140 RepID=A0A2Z5GA10_9BACT|nr:hypothetical protein ACPOL_6894 [Acidisarcina polymorpha]
MTKSFKRGDPRLAMMDGEDGRDRGRLAPLAGMTVAGEHPIA